MSFTWTLLRAGAFRLDGGSMFGVVPKAVWARSVEPDDANRIPLQTNCLLLERDDGSRVLIETGYGGKWSDKERAMFALEPRTILDALAEAGVDPVSIDTVIVTHLHFDHAGGLTHLEHDAPVSSFPNATIFVQQTEWDDALTNKSTMTRTYLRSHLDPIAGQVRGVHGETEVVPGVTVWPVPGHTWGQQAVRFEDDDGIVCFPGDVMPTASHAGAAYNMGYDMLPYTNTQTKLALLGRAHEAGWRIVLDHEPGEAVVTVTRDADRGRFGLAPVR